MKVCMQGTTTVGAWRCSVQYLSLQVENCVDENNTLYTFNSIYDLRIRDIFSKGNKLKTLP